jgi:N-acetylglucosaminyldiphosphoundecaprenol N-acetyl-beta-D-mannosaminyltransferase
MEYPALRKCHSGVKLHQFEAIISCMNGVETKNCPANPAIAILGVPFDNVTPDEARALINQMLASRQPHYLVIADIDFAVRAQGDEELRHILFDAHMVFCQGAPLAWACRLLGNSLPERLTASGLAPLLLNIANEKKLRLFLVGAPEDTLTGLVTKIKSIYPKIEVTGAAPDSLNLLNMDHAALRKKILEARPDILFVALGCPLQEKWIAMHYQSLGVPVVLGVGATAEFLSAQTSNSELTFATRLSRLPSRLFHRFIRDPWIFSWILLAQWWQLRPRSTPGGALHVSSPVKAGDTWQWVRLPERLDLAAIRNDVLLVDQVLADGRHCLLQLNQVDFIDSTGIGLLIRLHKKIRATGRQLILLDPSPAVKRALALMHLQDFFTTASDFDAAQEIIETREQEQAQTVKPATPAATPGPLVWQGEITAVNANDVWRMTEKYIAGAAPPSSGVAIDLTNVRFIDSTGLGIMIRARKLALLRGVKLQFTGAQSAVRNVLRLAQVESFLLGDGMKTA